MSAIQTPYMNLNLVKSLLPHRDPFLFIDEVVSVELSPENKKVEEKNLSHAVGAEVLCVYKTKKDHPIFEGHFPGSPILPGVIQIEMMAQGSSFFITKLVPDFKKIRLDVALLTVEKAKFRKPIFPNMELKVVAKCVKVRRAFITCDCAIYHMDELMSEATVMASIKY